MANFALADDVLLSKAIKKKTTKSVFIPTRQDSRAIRQVYKPELPVNYETIERLMGVSPPWIISAIEVDSDNKRAVVNIGLLKPGWFGARRSIQKFGDHHETWRHTNLGSMSCIVRVDFPEDDELPNFPWCGIEDSPFTNEMGEYVIAMFSDGMSLAAISRILDLDVDSLWKFKHGVDTGRLKIKAPSKTAQEPEAGTISKSTLPPESAEVWHNLLSGSKKVNLRNLGLRMILMRLQRQYSNDSDDYMRQHNIKELRRYFEMNQGALAHEISQL